jgi:hypothetical protein
MIDRCDQTIATWSAAGDNFVVKNVERFASVRTDQQTMIMAMNRLDCAQAF